jgi:hypothetical protein
VKVQVGQRIREFAAKAIEKRSALLTSTLNALAQFETTMGDASASAAKPELLGVLVSRALDGAVDALVSQVPGLSKVVSLYDGVVGELERAGRASRSLEMGDWIKDQRAAIDRALQGASRDATVSDLEERYLDLDREGRALFVQQVLEGVARMEGLDLTGIDELECSFYEQWINAHFTGIGDDAEGCIEFRYAFDGGAFDFRSCAVEAPCGDRIESAFNRLLDRGQVPRVQRPIDLRVRKRVAFWVDNLVGGKSWTSGWLDHENGVVHPPVQEAANRAFKDDTWRVAKRFLRR